MHHDLLALRYQGGNLVLNNDDRTLMSGRDPISILRAAKLFLSQEILWTANALARDDDGNVVRPNSPRASSWSVEGVIAILSNAVAIFPLYFARLLDHVIHTHFPEHVRGYLDEGSAATFGDFEAVFSYDVVMSVLDMAIKELENAPVLS